VLARAEDILVGIEAFDIQRYISGQPNDRETSSEVLPNHCSGPH
jgi:alpha,alpha-trehalose phosphorylase